MINVHVHNYVFYVCVCSFLPPPPFLLSLSELSSHDMRNPNYMKRPWLEDSVLQPQLIIQLTSRLSSQICWVGGWATCTSSPGKHSCHFRPTAIWLQSYERPKQEWANTILSEEMKSSILIWIPHLDGISWPKPPIQTSVGCDFGGISSKEACINWSFELALQHHSCDSSWWCREQAFRGEHWWFSGRILACHPGIHGFNSWPIHSLRYCVLWHLMNCLSWKSQFLQPSEATKCFQTANAAGPLLLGVCLWSTEFIH